MIQVLFIVQGQYVVFGEPKKPSPEVENKRFDSLKANSAREEQGKQAVPPHQEAVKKRRLSLYSALCVNVQCHPLLQVYSKHALPHMLRTVSLMRAQLQQAAQFYREGQEATQL